MVVRRLATMLLASVGALVVHQVAYLAAHPQNAGRQLALAGHAYLGSMASILVPVTMAVVIVHMIRSARRSLGGRRPSLLVLLWMQTALFAGQELAERSGSLERVLDEPAVAVGLILQVPVAWLLVRVVGELSRVIDHFVSVDVQVSAWARPVGAAVPPDWLIAPVRGVVLLPITRRGPPLDR